MELGSVVSSLLQVKMWESFLYVWWSFKSGKIYEDVSSPSGWKCHVSVIYSFNIKGEEKVILLRLKITSWLFWIPQNFQTEEFKEYLHKVV